MSQRMLLLALPLTVAETHDREPLQPIEPWRTSPVVEAGGHHEKFLSAATIVAAGLCAQPAFAKNDTATDNTSPSTSTQENKKVLAAKGGTILNTYVTPEQAKKAAEATNRQILAQRKTGH